MHFQEQDGKDQRKTQTQTLGVNRPLRSSDSGGSDSFYSLISLRFLYRLEIGSVQSYGAFTDNVKKIKGAAPPYKRMIKVPSC